jgi:hypothetical protein
MSDWWKANRAKLPVFTYVLRAVLTNSPNSGPPERLYSIFNSTFDGFAVNNHSDGLDDLRSRERSNIVTNQYKLGSWSGSSF